MPSAERPEGDARAGNRPLWRLPGAGHASLEKVYTLQQSRFDKGALRSGRQREHACRIESRLTST